MKSKVDGIFAFAACFVNGISIVGNHTKGNGKRFRIAIKGVKIDMKAIFCRGGKICRGNLAVHAVTELHVAAFGCIGTSGANGIYESFLCMICSEDYGSVCVSVLNPV